MFHPPPAGRGNAPFTAAAAPGFVPAGRGGFAAGVCAAAAPDPTVFPGFYNTDRLYEFEGGIVARRGRPFPGALSPSLFFHSPVTLVNRRSARAADPNHTTWFEKHNSSVVLGLPGSTVLTKGMERCLVVHEDTTVLTLEGITWLSSIPWLCSLRVLTRLVLDDLPIRGLPSLGSLVNLLELELANLVDMAHLPIGIGDAPRLRALSMDCLVDLEEFSIPLIRRLSSESLAGCCPRRLKKLHIEKCGCRVPDEINELLGLEEIWLQDTMDMRVRIPFPEIGRTLTALRTLTVMGYMRLESLPADMSGLTSLERLKIKNAGVHFDTSLGQLTALKQLIVVQVDVGYVPMELDELVNLEVLKFKECDLLMHIESNFLQTCRKLRKIHFSTADDHDRDGMFGDSIVYWQLAQMVPYMRNVRSFVILGGHEKEMEALADAFRSWPPHRVDDAMFDNSFYNYWRGHAEQRESTLPLTSSGIGGYYSRNGRMQAILREWRLLEEKTEVFAMSQHRRLGEHSIASRIDSLVLVTIVDCVLGRMAFHKKWNAHFDLVDKAYTSMWSPVDSDPEDS